MAVVTNRSRRFKAKPVNKRPLTSFMIPTKAHKSSSCSVFTAVFSEAQSILGGEAYISSPMSSFAPGFCVCQDWRRPLEEDTVVSIGQNCFVQEETCSVVATWCVCYMVCGKNNSR